MAVSVSKAGPYYASGEIKFSSLRSNFRAQQRKATSGGSETFATDNAPISASQLLRNTTTTDTSPTVPNATENSNIALSQSNWKTSQFRNSVKFFYITQSSTNENFDMDDLAWNGNLNKNINKFLFVTGTCGSNSVSSVAASFNATAYNLTFDVTGSILGAGGRGGGTSGAPDPSGEAAGTAMSVTSSSGNNVVVLVRSGARIYGGGGGGERGRQGSNGRNGECVERRTETGCGGCPGCPGGWSNDGGCWSGWHCSRRQVCNRWGNCWWVSNADYKYQRCIKRTATSGGTGGAGGTGGPGRGYNNQSGSLGGAAGSNGTAGGGCGATSGSQGETGGNGGDWSDTGGNTNNSGNGGSGGRAISGSNYSVTGTINSSTVKGAYNP